MKNFFRQAFKKINSIIKTNTEKKGGTQKKPRQKDKTQPVTQRAPVSYDQEKQSRRKRPPRKGGKKNRRPAKGPAESAVSASDADWKLSQFKVPAVEGKTRFHDLDLPVPLMHAISNLEFEYCTPIQAVMLPDTLSGKDASGRAQTGTGKTAAFLITVINRMENKPLQGKRKSGTPRVLILAPTRELVLQIADEALQLSKYCSIKIISVFGGMDYEKQRKQLVAGPVDIMVATPGRLLDFQRRREISLRNIEVLIIDEADRMLDMGFIPDVKKIIYSTPTKDKRQTLLFSATLTGHVTRLAEQWTRSPVKVEIEPEQVAVDTVEQVVYIVTTQEKFALLYNIITEQNLKRVLVFCNRRDEVRRLEEMLTRYGVNCSALSGEVSQKQRIGRLEKFKVGKIRVLVATDVAGRGIHIEGMDHVFNFSLPRDPEDYVHRIGRTGRAGASGTSISFADEEDGFYIPAIEEFMGRNLNCTQPEEEWLTLPKPAHRKKQPRPRHGRKPPRKQYASGRGNKSSARR